MLPKRLRIIIQQLKKIKIFFKIIQFSSWIPLLLNEKIIINITNDITIYEVCQ